MSSVKPNAAEDGDVKAAIRAVGQSRLMPTTLLISIISSLTGCAVLAIPSYRNDFHGDRYCLSPMYAMDVSPMDGASDGDGAGPDGDRAVCPDGDRAVCDECSRDRASLYNQTEYCGDNDLGGTEHYVPVWPQLPMPKFIQRWNEQRKLPEGPVGSRFHPLPTRPMFSPASHPNWFGGSSLNASGQGGVGGELNQGAYSDPTNRNGQSGQVEGLNHRGHNGQSYGTIPSGLQWQQPYSPSTVRLAPTEANDAPPTPRRLPDVPNIDVLPMPK